MSDYTIRPFGVISDFEECVRLQEETWGVGFSERVPTAILKVAQRTGGIAAGAYGPSGDLLGFVFGITGIEKGEPLHWSDMLAVRPELRGSGIGSALKQYQRTTLLEKGVRRMRWTFDPLQAKNAYLNIGKLGAIADEYVTDMYGTATGSPLHAGIGTDRLVALWRLDAPEVAHPLEGEGSDAPEVIRVHYEGEIPRPDTPRLELDDARLRLPVPADIRRIMETSHGTAVEWRRATRAAFTRYLELGYEVRGFSKGEVVSHYLLERTGRTSVDLSR